MYSAPNPKRSKKAPVVKVPFDWGANQNDELVRLIIQGALDTGMVANRSVFLLHMVNKEFKAAVEGLVKPKITALQLQYEEWRKMVRVHTQAKRGRSVRQDQWSAEDRAADKTEKENTAKAKEVVKLSFCLLAGSAKADKLVDYITDGHANRLSTYRYSNFSMRFTWTYMSAMLNERCMACAGAGKRCLFNCGRKDESICQQRFAQGVSQPFFARYSCIEWQMIDTGSSLHPMSDHERVRPKLTARDDRSHYNFLRAKTMLLASGIMDVTGSQAGAILCPANSPDPNGPLFLDKHWYVPKHHTLEGRLKLTNKQRRTAEQYLKANLSFKKKEDDAIAKARLLKFRHEFEMYMVATSSCSSTAFSLHSWPSLMATFAHLLKVHDPNNKNVEDRCEKKSGRLENLRHVQLYGSIFEIPVFRNLASNLKFAIKYLEGDKRYSIRAIEWACLLTAGQCPGKTGSWRKSIDNPCCIVEKTYAIDKQSDSLYDMYGVAVHLYDCISKPGWDFRIEMVTRRVDRDVMPHRDVVPDSEAHNSPMQWVLEHTGKGILIGGQLSFTLAYDDVAEWLKVLHTAFDEYVDSDIMLPRTVPPKAVWKNWHMPRCKDEILTFYQALTPLIFFEETRAPFLNMLQLDVEEMKRAAQKHYDRWGYHDTQPKVSFMPPINFYHYATFIYDEPGCEFKRLPPAVAPYKPVKVPDLPLPGHLDKQDGDAPVQKKLKGILANAHEGGKVCQPSPAYSPTSPAYSPNSPAYDPVEARLSPNPTDWERKQSGSGPVNEGLDGAESAGDFVDSDDDDELDHNQKAMLAAIGSSAAPELSDDEDPIEESEDEDA